MIKNLRKRLNDQKGLTLIELLAVIVILGIIAAIAVPSIGGLINKTKEDAKVAEAVQIVNAAKLYVSTNPKAQDLTFNDLKSYLEKVKYKSFTVKVTKNDTSGKFSYSLVGHEGSTIVNDSNTVTEDELLQFSGNDPEEKDTE
ncbi:MULTISPECIES: type II secretion system protein [Cytobacillus]|uniref:type II secretion system protein n=1 Tax=Cytobacillus TaxID=2675230 RepID=UPI00203D3AB8|nr:type II secretion system protein [Cytobacillus firmus]MCM3704442.1 type II secretion system GspH family protein [Cytobacillus firmus]